MIQNLYRTLRSDIVRLVAYLDRLTIAYSVGFFVVVGALVLIEPDLLPIAVAAVFVIPLRFTVNIATRFEETSYYSYSPLWANRSNRFFLFALLGFSSLPALHWLTGSVSWEQFGLIPICIAVASIAVLAWPETLYERNFYFDRWHPFERAALLGLGGLSLLSPLFIPLFLLIHYVVTRQFRYPEIGKFNYTHSALPHSMLFILSGVVVASLLFEFQPFMITFLLLCGYAGHYFYPGLEKLHHGPIYYVRNNNPIFMFMNAYNNGWMKFLPEEFVADIGIRSQRVRPLLNMPVLLIQLGTALIVVSYLASITFGLLTLLLHILIFVLTGDNFWRWGAVDIALVLGLILAGPSIIFDHGTWFAFSVLFIAFATAWSRPQKLGWLDTPYHEYYKMFADLNDGSSEVINPKRLTPYDFLFSWGLTGPFQYLWEDQKLTKSWGAVNSVEAHRSILDIYPNKPSNEEVSQLKNDHGYIHYDERSKKCKRLLDIYIKSGKLNGDIPSVISPPREFYVEGFSDSINHHQNIHQIRMVKIGGIWTKDSFEVITEETLFSIDVENN